MNAAELVDHYVAVLREQERMISSMSPYAEKLIEMAIDQALGEGRSSVKLPAPPSKQDVFREALYISQDAAVRRLWQASRIAYDIDETLWDELGHTDPETVVPGGLFSLLPHPNPFIAMPTPVILPLNGRDAGRLQLRIRGFFVTGRKPDVITGGYLQVSTHSPQANGKLGLLICCEVETLDGKPQMAYGNQPDMVFNRVTLDTGPTDSPTVAQMIDRIENTFDAHHTAGGRSLIAPMVTACVSALIYVCSKNAELRPLPASAANRAKAKGSNKQVKPVKVIRVGYEIGAALRAYRRREQTEHLATGATRRPHMRRAHFHLYWTGPKRTVPEMKWLSPIPVMMSEEPRKTTMVRVPK